MTKTQIAKVTIYSKGYCPYCKMAKKTLKKLGLNFDELDITNNSRFEQEMRQRSKRRSVPQIFIDELHIGGNDDLQAALRNGKLEKVLRKNTAVA